MRVWFGLDGLDALPYRRSRGFFSVPESHHSFSDEPDHPGWKILESALVYSAPPWLSVYCDRVELPDGTVIDEFHRVRMRDGVLIVAMTPQDELLTIRGYRHGARRVVLGLPAGAIEPGERPLDAAARELLEETGYAASEWETLGAFYVEPGRQYAIAHVVLARNARHVATPSQDASERFAIELVQPNRFIEVLRNEEAASLSMVAAISLALLHGHARSLRPAPHPE